MATPRTWAALKRTIDLAASGLTAPVTVPLVIVLALVVRAESPGPAIFKQQRVGLDGEVFTMYKLRTMRLGTGDRPSHEVTDAQVTRAGAVLRKAKLDELPQLLNVFLGHMSLVGPRPCLPSQHELIGERKARNVFTIRPGITGPAQIEGIDMSQPVALAEADAEYLHSSSLLVDLRCILATVTAQGSGDQVASSVDTETT